MQLGIIVFIVANLFVTIAAVVYCWYVKKHPPEKLNTKISHQKRMQILKKYERKVR